MFHRNEIRFCQKRDSVTSSKDISAINTRDTSQHAYKEIHICRIFVNSKLFKALPRMTSSKERMYISKRRFFLKNGTKFSKTCLSVNHFKLFKH